LYSKICVIGLGTLGGFLAKNLSELETTKELVLIDYDTVEIENIKNSIYLKSDVGRLKTAAILDKINSDAKVSTINTKFIEGKTKIDNHDLILDCRDFTYARENLIDARLYISFRKLIIDCRKNVKYEKQHEGRYALNLSKTEIKVAALNATILISNGIFKELVAKQLVQEIPIDEISEKTKHSVSQKNPDLIYDSNVCEHKLINLHRNYSSIIDLNKNNELTVCVGDRVSPYIKKTIAKNNLQSINDIMSEFSSLVKAIPIPFNYYVITVNNYQNNYYVEILPETGSA
jgi:hypothetical protein